jgi:membrane protein YdbS with pleckstrin-like domain
MPNDVKAVLSVIFLIVAAILAYWRGSPIRPDFSTYIIVTAFFMVVAMWIFPEAGVKKGDPKKGTSPGQNKADIGLS